MGSSDDPLQHHASGWPSCPCIVLHGTIEGEGLSLHVGAVYRAAGSDSQETALWAKRVCAWPWKRHG